MQSRAWSFAGACVMLMAASGLLSACGSSSSSKTTSTATSAPTGSLAASTSATGNAATGAPIKIGLITGLTGPFSANLAQVGNVAHVWQEAVNGSGGINGSPVQVIVKDDSSDPSKALVAARELVSDGVVAVAGSWDVTAPSYAPYLAEHGIPDVGGSPNDFPVENGASFFPSGGNDVGLVYGVVANAAHAGAKKLAVMYCAEYPNCTALANSTVTMATEIGGISVVSRSAISATSPSYTAQCIAAKQAGADSMYVNDAGPTLPQAISQCQQQGFNVHQYNNANDTNGSFFKNSVAGGMILSLPNMPASDTSTPGGKYFNEMLNKYDPGITSQPTWNESMTTTWAGLQLFREAAQLGNVTASSKPDAVFNGLYKIKDYTIGGLAPPVTFEKGKGTFVNCWFTGEIKGGKVSASSSTPSCIPNSQQSTVLKAFGAA